MGVISNCLIFLQSEVYSALENVICDCKNFKVSFKVMIANATVRESCLSAPRMLLELTIFHFDSSVEFSCFLFQVRINAVLALSVPPERRYYGDTALYCHVYATLIDTLKGTENVTEFSEFKYRDTLRQQV